MICRAHRAPMPAEGWHTFSRRKRQIGRLSSSRVKLSQDSFVPSFASDLWNCQLSIFFSSLMAHFDTIKPGSVFNISKTDDTL